MIKHYKQYTVTTIICIEDFDNEKSAEAQATADLEKLAGNPEITAEWTEEDNEQDANHSK